MDSTTPFPFPSGLAGIAGAVITPADPGYDKARAVFYGGIDKRPGLIVQVANAEDVARAVDYARDNGLELAVRGGGHSPSGHSTTAGGVVIDLRKMKALDIDAAAGTAWAEAGLTAGEVTQEVGKHGLAVGFGDAGSVGIGGITLGGGVGFLVRKHGLTIDSLLAAEVVTADGRIVQADEKTNPELFWAIRGGGGNFGVVTRLKFRLHRLDKVVGGLLVLPATPETVAGFIAAAEAAPDELSTIANIMPAPPMPFLPKEVHGQFVILGMLVYAGDPAKADAVLAPFRALAKPHADMLRPMGLHEMYGPEDPNYKPLAVARTMYLDRVDVTMAADIIDRLKRSEAAFRVTQLRVLGGAHERVANEATAYAHRQSRIMVNVAAFYEKPEQRAARDAWVASFANEIRQSDEGCYVNFLAQDGSARMHQAYPGGTWERLRAAKAKYDPTNLFRLNQNIPPAKAA